MNFLRKVVIVTGASSGIGAETAVRFAEKGANVVVVGRNEANLKLCLEKCSQFPNKDHLIVVADLEKPKEVESVIEKTIEKFKRLDILVNNAGAGAYAAVYDMKMADFDRILNLNLRSVVHMTTLACPYLIESKGNIVNVSSIGGMLSSEGGAIYSTSKAALDMFTRCSSLDLAKKGVRVNSVNPGLIETDFHKRVGMSEEEYQAYIEKAAKNYPMQRIGQPKDVADAILYLASDSAAFITGVLLPVSGGKHTQHIK